MVFFRKEEVAANQPTTTPEEGEFTALQQAIEKASLPQAAAAIAAGELSRLKKTDQSLPEYAITHSYLTFLAALPWKRATDDHLYFKQVQVLLDKEHYGLAQVKERVVEFLAVQNLREQKKYDLLVVDDEQIARTNLGYVLAKEGYRVETAANGLEALSQLQKRRFDLVLTDLKMDKMDGNQLLEAAKQLDSDTQVVMITGFATVGSAVEALRKGAAHYLPKPVNFDELRAVIRQILNNKQRLQLSRGPVLCFTGPPGTGKTSIGRGIAAALGRKFVRISLAGLKDEAELRGHRRTYVGAMPGRILNEIKRVGVKNPVFMLDEIDKIGNDFQGDASAVLLELLDPEQNTHFSDHYLDIPFDLSSAIFIATANVIENIPGPLRDRLERIEFAGYTEREKLSIAQQFLVPRQLSAASLEEQALIFEAAAILKIIRDHTREAGLRGLEREIAAVCRKLARLCVVDQTVNHGMQVDAELVAKLLGPPKYAHAAGDTRGRIGVAAGLAWTEAGGEIMYVEAGIMKGTQQLILTGSLGQVLQESARTALSYIRSQAETFGIEADFFSGRDIHIHLPSGAISKDGPSAGLALALALISLLTRRHVRPDVAMTGELSLTGRILPVAGLREKLLAAQREHMSTIIVPAANSADVQRLEAEIVEGLEVVLVDDFTQVVEQALEC
ncbi:MAG: ATP-dependent protease [Desulfatitalea sp. BRH_c12]|nr:MAG: ATP-dependent protease [Desulfatitalea sp. BRH_c12]